MKTKDVVLIAVAVVAVLLFAVFMFNDSRESEKNRLLRKDVVNDSLIMLKQREFEDVDSLIFDNLDRHEKRLYRLEYIHKSRDVKRH